MRKHSLRILCLLLLTVAAIPVHPDPTKDSYGLTLAKSAGSSAASAGGVAVAKFLVGAFYDATCAKEVTKDLAEKYFCDIIGGFAGKKEEEWKAEVTAELKHISSKLGDLEKGQKDLQYELDQTHKEMYRLFKQAAAEQIATKSEVGFERLWTDFQRQFDKVDEDTNRAAMIKFAKQVLSEKMENALGDYNTVLTKSFRGNQALLRYPFYDYKERKGFSGGSINFNNDKSFDKMYDAAEMAFMDARARQEKVHALVMWAIKALEIDCKKNPATCVQPPYTSAEFKKKYDANTIDQIKAYNEGLDWLLFTYGQPQWPKMWFLPGDSETWLTRANFLNASLAGDGNGMWGRVISMGTGWDGTISVNCNGVSGKVKPLFSYYARVDGPNNLKVLDWWTSRAGNGVYDEVHFSQDWTVYHYYLPQAKPGACTVSESLDKGIIPYTQPWTAVMKVKRADSTEVEAGSFIAIHRPTSTYAMASGSVWRRADKALEDNSNPGHATIKNEAFRSQIIEGPGTLAKAGMLSEGRGEMTAFQDDGGRVHKRHQMYLFNDKNFYFPEGGPLKLVMEPASDCLETCRGSSTVEHWTLDYDIWNGKGKKEKGKLDAIVSVFFHTKTFDPRSISDAIKFNTENNGIVVNGTYDWTNDNQKKTFDGFQKGTFKPDSNTAYKLQYLIDFNMVTEGTGWDATQWVYRARIAPYAMYVAK